MYSFYSTLLVLAIIITAALQHHAAGEITVTPVTSPQDHLEAPHWDEEKGVLFFVDVTQHNVNRYDPNTQEFTSIKIPRDAKLGFVIPVKGTEDKFIVTSGRDVILLTWDGKNKTDAPKIEPITSVEPLRIGNRFNDGKADITGRVWAGTMGLELITNTVVVPFTARLYSIDPDSNKAVTRLDPVSVSNGLAWNADNTIMYYIDSLTFQISAFDFNVSSATLKNRRTVFNLLTNFLIGIPDGMTIDSNENLLFALLHGGQVIHINPRSGALLQKINIPAKLVTSVMFGGPDMDTLYVTTARDGLTDAELKKQPLAGSLFAVRGLGVKALAPANKAERIFY